MRYQSACVAVSDRGEASFLFAQLRDPDRNAARRTSNSSVVATGLEMNAAEWHAPLCVYVTSASNVKWPLFTHCKQPTNNTDHIQ